MTILRIKAYQVFANFRKPMSYNFIDTYPLPPFSTIKGWFHSVIGATDYIPLNMCIQGTITSVIHDIQTFYKFDRKDKDRIAKGYPVLESFNKTLTRTPIYVALLYDCDFTFYIQAAKEYLELFKNSLLVSEYPFLGRHEDLMRIDSVEYIQLTQKKYTGMRNRHKVNYGIYLKNETARALQVKGINYRLSHKYEIVNGVRDFSKGKIDVVYVDNISIENSSFLFDQEANRIVELIGDYSG